MRRVIIWASIPLAVVVIAIFVLWPKNYHAANSGTEIYRFHLALGKNVYPFQIDPSIERFRLEFQSSSGISFPGDFSISMYRALPASGPAWLLPDDHTGFSSSGTGFSCSDNCGFWHQGYATRADLGSEQNPQDGGLFELKTSLKNMSGPTDVVVYATYRKEYSSASSYEEALARLKKNPSDTGADQFVHQLWREKAADPDFARQLLQEVLLRPILKTREIYRTNAPVFVELETGNIPFLQCFRDYSTLTFSIAGEQKQHSETFEVRWGGGCGGNFRFNVANLLNPGAGEHKVRVHVKLEGIRRINQTAPVEETIREWDHPDVDIHLVDQLPHDSISRVTNPELDQRVRSGIRVESVPRISYNTPCLPNLLIRDPLPIALGHELYVSVDGQTPVPAIPKDVYSDDQCWIIAGNKVENRSRETRLFGVGVPAELIPGLDKPGKHRIKYLLKPTENAALANFEDREFWGGTFETPEMDLFIPSTSRH